MDALSYENLQALGDVAGVVSRGLSADSIGSIPSLTLRQLSKQRSRSAGPLEGAGSSGSSADACGGGDGGGTKCLDVPHRCTICLVDLEDDGGRRPAGAGPWAVAATVTARPGSQSPSLPRLQLKAVPSPAAGPRPARPQTCSRCCPAPTPTTASAWTSGWASTRWAGGGARAGVWEQGLWRWGGGHAAPSRRDHHSRAGAH
jgi:hypothetical protein